MPEYKFDLEKTYHGTMTIEAKDELEAEKLMLNKLHEVDWEDPNFQYEMEDENGYKTDWSTFD